MVVIPSFIRSVWSAKAQAIPGLVLSSRNPFVHQIDKGIVKVRVAEHHLQCPVAKDRSQGSDINAAQSSSWRRYGAGRGGF